MGNPPKRPQPQAGETWFAQLYFTGSLVICVHVEELTEKTCVLRQLPELGQPPALKAYRFKTTEVGWVERAPDQEITPTLKGGTPDYGYHFGFIRPTIEPSAWDADVYLADGYATTKIFQFEDPTGKVDQNPVDVIKHYAETAMGLELTDEQLAVLFGWREELERPVYMDVPV